jgi:hypothetical protein
MGISVSTQLSHKEREFIKNKSFSNKRTNKLMKIDSRKANSFHGKVKSLIKEYDENETYIPRRQRSCSTPKKKKIKAPMILVTPPNSPPSTKKTNKYPSLKNPVEKEQVSLHELKKRRRNEKLYRKANRKTRKVNLETNKKFSTWNINNKTMNNNKTTVIKKRMTNIYSEYKNEIEPIKSYLPPISNKNKNNLNSQNRNSIIHIQNKKNKNLNLRNNKQIDTSISVNPNLSSHSVSPILVDIVRNMRDN